MSSNPSDVLGTIFLFVLICIISFIAFGNLVPNEKPATPLTTLSHRHIEPQVVLSTALCAFDLPPPRETVEPTFEPRPEPEPLPRRNGLIPRAERRVRPEVFAKRRGQRERHMTEMSTRERVAAADKEAAREAYKAHKEQERSWRSKAITHEEAEAASRTGGSLATESGHGERKQLGINVGAADSYPRKSQGVQIERPDHEGSNALTGTALGDKIGAAYAPPMEGVEGAGAAQPLAGEVQESYRTPADNTSKAAEENNASNKPLAGEVQETNNVSAGHNTTTAETQSENPLLNMNEEDLAAGLNTELSMLQQVKADGKADDSWDRRVRWVYTSWQGWISSGNTLTCHFDKLKPMVDSMFTTFKTRCGKRKAGLPADALDETLAIVSVVWDDMNGALGSATTEQSASEVQSPNDEQLSHDQEQIAQDRESAEILEHQLLQQDAQVADDHELAKSLEQEQLHPQQRDAQIVSDHELAKSIDQQQQQQQQQQPLHQQTYIQGDFVDQETGTRKQNYPEPVIASGSGTYPRKDWARQRIDIQVPNSPWIRPTWLPKLEEGPPGYEVVTLASEQFAQGPEYTLAGDDMIVHTERVSTGQINTSVEDVTVALGEQSNTGPVNPPTNPLLEQHSSKAWKMLESWLDEADSTFKTLTRDEAAAWSQGLNILFARWSHWITHRDHEIWRHVEPCRVVQLANVAFGAHGLIEGLSLTVTDDVIHVCKKMSKMKHLAEMEEQARIKAEAEQESIRMAQFQEQQQQQQQLAQKLAAEEHEERACINEEERQKSVGMAQTQSQQRPWTPPPMENQEDLYGLSPPRKGRTTARAQPEINAVKANEAKSEFVPASDDEFDASLREAMGSDGILPDSGVQQQHVGAPSQSHQQAPPALLANIDAVPAAGRSPQVKPQTNSANVVAPEIKQHSEDKMEIEPKNALNKKLDKATADEAVAQKAAGEAVQKKVAEEAAKKNNADEVAKRKSADEPVNGKTVDEPAKRKTAGVAALAAGRTPKAGHGEDKALFEPDDVQKRHRDDVEKARAKAEADIAAAAAEKAEYEAAKAASENARSTAQKPQTNTEEVQFMSNAVRRRHQFQSRKDLEALAAAERADAEARSAPVEETKAPDEVAQQKALDQGWEMKDIKLEAGEYPLQGEVTLNRALVLVTAWLQLNNGLVRTLQKQFKPSEYKVKATTMPHGRHFMAKIKQISSRYRQLRHYACVKVAGTDSYDWNLENISLKNIKENDFEQLISTDLEFLTTLKDAFATPDRADKSRKLEIDESRKIVLEAHANIMAVSHAISRIPSPAESSDDRSDSDENYYGDATPAVKAAIKKEEDERKASRPDTRPPGSRSS